MTAPCLSIDSKPPVLFDTTRMCTPGKHTSLPTDDDTLQSREWNQVRGERSRYHQEIIPRAIQHQQSSNRESEYMGKTQAKGGIFLLQACSTIINETSKRLAWVIKQAWGNAAYIETLQIHSLGEVGRLVRGRWRFKTLTTCAAGARWKGVALTPGKSQGGRGEEPKTGSKDRYKRRHEEGAKGIESMGHEKDRGVENSEVGRNGADSDSPENPSISTQNHSNKTPKQSAFTSSPRN